MVFAVRGGLLVPWIADATNPLTTDGIMREEVPSWKSSRDAHSTGQMDEVFEHYLRIVGACVWGAMVTQGWEFGQEAGERVGVVAGNLAPMVQQAMGHPQDYIAADDA